MVYIKTANYRITVSPRNLKNIQEEIAEAKIVIKDLKKKGEEIEFLQLRRTLPTTTNKARIKIKELSLPENMDFGIKPKDRFLKDTNIIINGKDLSEMIKKFNKIKGKIDRYNKEE